MNERSYKKRCQCPVWYKLFTDSRLTITRAETLKPTCSKLKTWISPLQLYCNSHMS